MNNKCLLFFAALLFCFGSSLHGGITSHVQSSLERAEEEPASQTKCPSGGCYEGAPLKADYPVLVFMSFSMPEAALLSFAQELEIYGGVFVIRGIPNNSFAEFFHKLNHLKDLGMDAPILIDPDSFENYQVTEVPTIVLKGEQAFDKIIGNIPISCALETFAEKGEESLLARDIQGVRSKHEIHQSRGSQ